MKIGFFDSGLGGLTILNAVVKQMPDYSYEFYGDTENLPYGDKSEEDIYKFTKRGVEYLFERGCKLIIIACNTASAETLRRLQQQYLPKYHSDKKILGVIIPTVEAVLESPYKQITVIGTNRTINSKKYDQEFSKIKNDLSIQSIATPSLVPLIENGDLRSALSEVEAIVDTFAGERVVVLGCTHYTVLKEKLKNKYSKKKILFISQDEIIPMKLKLYLENHPEIERSLDRKAGRNIYLTRDNNKYDNLLSLLFGQVPVEGEGLALVDRVI